MSFSINPLWNLADTLTIIQAAALIAEVDPNSVRFNAEGVHGTTDSTNGRSVKTAYEALKNAVLSNKLNAKIIHDSRPIDQSDTQTLVDMMELEGYANPCFDILAKGDEHVNNGYFVKSNPNWEKSSITVDDLRAWLLSRGYSTGFFFQNKTTEPDYFNKNSPYYAPKLAAAIRAWEAISTDEKYSANGKTVKQNLMNWLIAHASEYDLIKDDGDINNEAIENQLSKVANWNDKGGASKTPTKQPTH
mgnify:CR=1 FL=1